jgi:drug/metabolite transporter (DMT)-like permease
MKHDASQVFPPHLIGVLVALTLAWGFNWPMIKLSLAGMAPMHFRTWCLAAGAAVLFTMAAARGLPWRVPRAEWRRLAIISLANITVWNVLSVHGVALMASGRASILGYTMPMWTVLLGTLVLGEPFTRRRAVGVALGMAGMLLLLGAELQAVGRAPAGVSGLSSLMVPVVGVFSGALVLGETPRWSDYAALVLVVGSLATVLIPARRPAALGSAPAERSTGS